MIIATSFHSIDTNGPMGECWLPMNEENDVYFSDVIICNDLSTEHIMSAIQNWLAFLQMDVNLEVENLYVGKNMLQFEGKLPVGKKYIGTPAVLTFVELNWETSISDVEFRCRIEVKDGKFRYTFKNFITEREGVSYEEIWDHCNGNGSAASGRNCRSCRCM